MTKQCIICGKEFKPRNSKHLCCSKKCSKVYTNQSSKKYYYLNKEKRLEYQKQYRFKNQDKIKNKYTTYYSKICIICGKEFVTTKSKKFCCSNECNKIRERKQAQEYLNNRYKDNINFKLTVLCRNYFKRCMNFARNHDKQHHTLDVYGYTIEQLKQRLEFQFKNGMTWDNYGTYWEVHHKKELNKFNFGNKNNLDYKQIKLANSLANLKPVTKEEHNLIHKHQF